METIGTLDFGFFVILCLASQQVGASCVQGCAYSPTVSSCHVRLKAVVYVRNGRFLAQQRAGCGHGEMPGGLPSVCGPRIAGGPTGCQYLHLSHPQIQSRRALRAPDLPSCCSFPIFLAARLPGPGTLSQCRGGAGPSRQLHHQGFCVLLLLPPSCPGWRKVPCFGVLIIIEDPTM